MVTESIGLELLLTNDSVHAGEMIGVYAKAYNTKVFKRKNYSYSTNGGLILRSKYFPEYARIETSNLAPGKYTIKAHVCYSKRIFIGSCASATFEIKE